jgi:uncharacterized membrane protein YfcA
MMAALGLETYAAGSIVILVATALVAGLARGFSGFGAALIFMPVAAAFMSAQIAAPLLLIVDMLITIPLIPGAIRYADRREVALMALGSLIGVPLGTWALALMNPLAVRWMIIALIVPMLALLMSGWRYPGRTTAAVTTFVGGVSGFFNGVAQVGGPPLVLYWLRDAGKALTMRASIILLFAISNLISIPSYFVGGVSGFFNGVAQVGGPPLVLYWLRDAGKALTMRASIILLFAISNLISIPSYFVGGLWSRAIIGLAIAIGPAYALGLWLGSHMFRLASEATFRHICYALIAIAALVSLPVFDGWR